MNILDILNENVNVTTMRTFRHLLNTANKPATRTIRKHVERATLLMAKNLYRSPMESM